MQVINRRSIPRESADLPAQTDAESQQHDERLANGRQGRGVPIAKMHAHVASEDGSALPGQRGCKSIHGRMSEESSRNKSSRVGGRTSYCSPGYAATKAARPGASNAMCQESRTCDGR